MSATPTIAYLAQGRLHVKAPESPPRAIESRFGQSLVERALSMDRRHSWKAQGRGAQFMSRGLMWGAVGSEADGLGLSLTGLSPGREPGELLYSLETKDIAGVFALREGGEHEQRLFHGNERRVRHLSTRPGLGRIACSTRHASGTAGIALMNADGSDLTEVTEGDSVDEAPAFVPGDPETLVFQSAGIGRDGEGRYLTLGPSAVKRLRLATGDIETVAESPEHDFLGPRVAPDGSLLYIRRPYRGAHRFSLPAALKDLLLLPARLVMAIFHWLNFFSVRYSGKPLTTAGGPRREGADIRQMMIWGNLVDAEQAAREAAARGEESPGLVPASWELVRHGAAPEVLARSVLSFDVGGDGAVVFSNGSAVFLLEASGPHRLVADSTIEQVVIVE
jgi:hypothetical protein